METNVIYTLFSFLSILLCTYLYTRTLHKIEKYWDFIVYSIEVGSIHGQRVRILLQVETLFVEHFWFLDLVLLAQVH